MNRDLMNNARPRDVATSTMTILDRMQNFQPHVQVMGAAAVFLSLAEFYGVDATDAFRATKNLINGSDGKPPASWLPRCRGRAVPPISTAPAMTGSSVPPTILTTTLAATPK